MMVSPKVVRGARSCRSTAYETIKLASLSLDVLVLNQLVRRFRFHLLLNETNAWEHLLDSLPN